MSNELNFDKFMDDLLLQQTKKRQHEKQHQENPINEKLRQRHKYDSPLTKIKYTK